MKKKNAKMDTEILEKAIDNNKLSKRERIRIYVSKKQFWQALSVVLAVVFVFSLVIFYSGSTAGSNQVSKEQVKSNTLKFVKAEMVAPGVNVDLINFTEEQGLYKIVLNLSKDGQSQEVTSYVTKSGELFFPQAIEIPEEYQPKQEDSSIVPAGILKTDKPDVELFVMAYCPFGTQIEKGILPVVETLKDKINFDVKFVYYAMHGKKELDEQLTQYCIETEYNDKYLDYLSCFLEDGNSTRCLDKVGLTKSDLSQCITDTDNKYNVTGLYNDQSTWLSGRFPLFNVFKEDNEKYEVGGSPTLVINGEKVNTQRDSASLLKIICSAFNNEPEACNTQLSSETPAPGFGYEGTGTSSGSCG